MKEITISTLQISREEIPNLLTQYNINVNDFANIIFNHKNFDIINPPQKLNLVFYSLSELGFVEKATLNDIFVKIADMNLKPCHISTALFLRLAYLNQPPSNNSIVSSNNQSPDGAVIVLSEPLEYNQSLPKGFYLRNVDNHLWLRGYVCDDTYLWELNDIFVFETI